MPESMSRVARLPGLVAIAEDLGKVLAAHGYTPTGLSTALQPDTTDSADAYRVAPDHFEAAVLARRLASPQLPALVRLFLAGAAIPQLDATDALQPLELEALIDAGLLIRTDDGLQAAVRIGWCDGLLVCHDWHDGRTGHREDVVGVAQASLTLADLTVRLPDVDALDVGTGGGVQAFLATRHAKTVTGTDINSRALDLAALGTALNDLPSLAWREGSLLEPVGDDTFDLITVNPPFIISPDNSFMWRDAGQSGAVGGLCPLLLSELNRHLRPDGWASMLASWIHDADGDWSSPLRSWLAESDCDAWILRFSSQDQLSYAHTWLAQTEHSSKSFTSALDRWMKFYAEHHIEALATGAIVLHRAAQDGGHMWIDEMPVSPTGPAGEQIRRAFRQRKRLSRLADRDLLLDESLAPLPGTTLDQTLHRHDGAYHPAPSQLWVQPGLTIGATVPPVALPVFLELDGERPLRDLVNNAIKTTGFDPDDVAAKTLATAVRLIELGIVEWR
jgi:methylase of polypeptide subunit release factors